MNKELNNIVEQYLTTLKQNIYNTANFLEDEIINVYSYLENSVLRGKLSGYIDESFFDDSIKNILSYNYNHIFLDCLDDLFASFKDYSKSINNILDDKNKEDTEKIEEIREQGNSFIDVILYGNASFKRKLMRDTQGLEGRIIESCKYQIRNKIRDLPYSMQDNAYYEMQEKVKIFARKFEDTAYDEFSNLYDCFERNFVDKKILSLKEEFDVNLSSIKKDVNDTNNDLLEQQKSQYQEIIERINFLKNKYGEKEINQLINTQSNSKKIEDFCIFNIKTLFKKGKDLSPVLNVLDKISGAMEFIKYKDIFKQKSEQLENTYGIDVLNKVVNSDGYVTYNIFLKEYMDKLKNGKLDGEFIIKILDEVDKKVQEEVSKKNNDNNIEIVELKEENNLNTQLSNNTLSQQNISTEANTNEYGEIIRDNVNGEQIIEEDEPVFEIPMEVVNNEEVNIVENNSIYNEVKNAIEKNGLNPDNYYKENQEYSDPYEDRNFVLDQVRKDGRLLKNAKNFQNDREIVLEAIRSKGSALKYASEDLRNDKDFVLEAIRRKGVALRYASPTLKSDKEFVLSAIKSKSIALKYANPSFKNDRNFVIEAVKNNGLALRYISEFQNDSEVVEIAIKQNKKAIKYASLEIQEKYRKINQKEDTNILNQTQENNVEQTINNDDINRLIELKESMLNNNVESQPQTRPYADEFDKILGRNNNSNNNIENKEIEQLLQAKETLLNMKKYIPYEEYNYNDNYYKSAKSR